MGRLEPVNVRTVWVDEARDLTPWLADNPELLGEALGMDLELVDREVSVGPFSADLLFRTVGGDAVVVEHMIDPTDHDRLGKLITYGAGLDAACAVLVAERFRPEHRAAWSGSTDTAPMTSASSVSSCRCGGSVSRRPRPVLMSSCSLTSGCASSEPSAEPS